ncbi:MAG: carbohydrate porin [Bdellovibrionota bacterium]
MRQSVHTFRALVITGILLLGESRARAADQDGLLGDWLGARSALKENNILPEIVDTQDVFASMPHIQGPTLPLVNSLDLRFSAPVEDTDRLFRAEFVATAGNQISEDIGTNQFVSNIEGTTGFHLYELWARQKFFDRRVQVLVGLRDFSSDFDRVDQADCLLNNSFSTEPVASQTGASLYSQAPLAARVTLFPLDWLYAQGGVYFGSAAGKKDIHFGMTTPTVSDGQFYALELGAVHFSRKIGANDRKLSVGAWLDNEEFEGFEGGDKSSSAGGYAIAEGVLWKEKTDPTRNLGAFVQFAYGGQKRNQIGSFLGFGLKRTGTLRGRDEDVITLGYAKAKNSSAYLDVFPESEKFETVIELSYQFRVNEFWTIQPDFQLIYNPLTEETAKTAKVAGLRLTVAL